MLNPVRLILSFVLTTFFLAASGCTNSNFGGGHIYSNPAWEESHGTAGNVLLIVSAAPDYEPPTTPNTEPAETTATS